MARETSIEAYHRVKETGILSSLRLKVFEILCFHGPMTANEMRQFGDPNANSGVYSTRLSELREMKIVRESPKRPCKTTGYNAIVWDVITEGIPIKFENTNGTSQKEKMAQIRKEICTARGFLTKRLDISNLFDGSYKPMVDAIEAIDRALILF